ncbi:MAG: GAF domain-containing sensor histidine kinase [Nitrospirota bacterium]|nr:GAF domain-containing sensor histidine kinase [Nitrospirota bacterium]
MQVAAIPDNEQARIQALLQYEILDTEAEAVYDDFVKLASYICHTPIALISLVDPTRQWFKAKVGCAAPETSRDMAFCAHAILQTDVLVVPDTLTDQRFVDNPLVTGDPHIRFYAGAPLLTPEGFAIGTLCAIDDEPRMLSLEQITALQALARQVVAQLELRRLTKELQQLVESKNKLFHIVSHDLRSPFNGILAFSQTLAEEAETLSREDIQEFSQTVLTSAEQVMHLIDNLLQCTRFELGTLDYQPTSVAIDTVVMNVVMLLKGNATQKNIDLVYQANPSAEVFADSTMLHSIVQNLVGNALKFTPAEGRVTIQTEEQDTMIQVSVIDTGVGVSPDKLAGLFEVMAGRTTDGTSGEKGTGLGLLLCKDFVEKHGGRVWVDSVMGQGAAFHFTLPKAYATLSV